MNSTRIPKSEDFMLTNSPGEKKVFRWLVSLPEPWCFWHSKWFTKYITWNPRKINFSDSKNFENKSKPVSTAECDFIVFHPNKGFIVLEVKGGLIKTEHGSLIQYTKKEKLVGKTDPINQAINAHNALRNYYVDSTRFQNKLREYCIKTSGGHDFPGSHSFGIIFPDCDWKSEYSKNYVLKGGFHHSQIYDQSDIKKFLNFEDYLNNVLEIYNRSIENEEISNFFIRIVSSPVKGYQIKGLIFKEQIKYLSEMNRLQDSIVDLFHDLKRAGFKGSAGTGKTYLAMKEIIKESNYNNEILFLCYNNELAREINSKIEFVNYYEEKVNPKSRIIISSIISYFNKLYIEEFKISPSFSLFSGPNKIEKEVFLQIIKKKSKFDIILIDEAQDIHPGFYNLILALMKDQKKSKMFLYYDDNQNVFSNKFDFNELAIPKDQHFNLTMNIRNVNKIRKWIQQQTTLGTYKRGLDIEGYVPVIYPSTDKININLSTALTYISDEIWKLVTVDLVRSDDIVVLSKFTLKHLKQKFSDKNIFQHAKLQKNWIYLNKREISNRNHGFLMIVEPKLKNDDINYLKVDYKTNSDDANFFILFNTIYKFKGLEKPVVFILWEGDFSNELYKRRELYNLASRAQLLLYIVKFK